MDIVKTACAEAERSYQRARASAGRARVDLLASGPRGLAGETRTDFSRAAEQERHFRGWVFACVRCIAQKIAGQPIRAGRVAARHGAKAAPAIAQLESHPALTLLNDPSELQTGWSLLFSTISLLELTGRCLWWVPEQEGRLWVYPLPSSWLVGVVGATRREAFLVRPPGHAGDPLVIPSTEACYFHYPDPADPRGCVSPLQAAAAAVEADDAIQASQRQMFARGIFPGIALILGEARGADGNLTDRRPVLTGAQRGQLIESVRKIYAGVSRHHEPLILDNVIRDVKTLSNSPQEMDWLTSAKDAKARICQIFGVNPVVLGELEGANRASALEAERHFVTSCVNPKLRLLSDSLTEWLAPRFGGGLRLWVEPCVVDDHEMQFRWAQLLLAAAAIGGDELRALAPFQLRDDPQYNGKATLMQRRAGAVANGLLREFARVTDERELARLDDGRAPRED